MILSHLFMGVSDTDATIRFWCEHMGATLESDEILSSPALDQIYGRKGARIRDTFIRAGGLRLHTIEVLDVRVASGTRGAPGDLGIRGISFRVPDLEAFHRRLTESQLNPTPIYRFSEIETPVNMFFVEDPDGIRIEVIEGVNEAFGALS